MDDGSDHGVVVMREVRRILMHREGRALLGGLDEHFAVVKLNVWAANTVCGAAGDAVIEHQLCKPTRLKLNIMAVAELRDSTCSGAAPGWVFNAAQVCEPCRQGVALISVEGSLSGGEETLDQHIAVVTEKLLLLIRQHGCYLQLS